MFSRIHEKLGTAGFVLAVVALIAALTGTAFAAASLNGKQKKEVKKIAKQFAGKPGATGPAGPAGAAGAAGPAGKEGPAGPKGATGATGVTGSAGTAGTTGATGVTGATGATGFSGFTETLPSGKTETGTWAASGTGETAAALSFAIPLAADQDQSKVVLIEEGASVPAECDNGSGAAASSANPEADPGFLCVFEAWFTAPTSLSVTFKNDSTFTAGYSKTGAVLIVDSGSEATDGGGSFAVTAP